MSVLNRAQILAGSQGNQTALKNLFEQMDQSLVRLQTQGGFNLSGQDPSQLIGAPTASPSWTVQGIDGHFIVRIAPAQVGLNQQATTADGNAAPGDPTKFSALPVIVSSSTTPIVNVLYQFQSSLNSTFDGNGSVVTYPATGASPELAYDIAGHPNEVRFWRIRSRMLSSAFTPWYPLLGPLGALAVNSSFERSTSVAPRSVVNTNNATVDSVDAGSNDTIRGYGPGGVGSSFTRFDGQNNQIATPGFTILGAAYDTDYSVVMTQAISFQSFPIATQYIQTIQDAFFYIATLHTVKAGGTGGTSGGGTTTGAGTGTSGARKLPQL